MGSMALRFLERELRRELAGIGREALMRSAVERREGTAH